MERARGLIDWEKRRAFAADLAATTAVITDELGRADPAAAGERLVRLLAGAEGVFERVDDSAGQVQDVYLQAAAALPGLAAKLAEGERARLSERLVPLLTEDGYGLVERAAADLIPLLPPPALAQLDGDLVAAADATEGLRKRTNDWGPRLRLDRILRARQMIADARGDVDTFLALEQARPSRLQDHRGVAERLLAAGRAAEALERVRQAPRGGELEAGVERIDLERVRLEARILEALEERDAAQALRWRAFEVTLDAAILREHLAHLPDFAEFEVLDRAFGHAAGHADRYAALALFVAWPRLDLAGRLVLEHRGGWEGRHYGVLAPAAEELEAAQPAAAAVLYRALIDDILLRARSTAYGHAARYLARLEALPLASETAPDLPDHATYRGDLLKAHGRKAAFWALVGG